MTHKFAKHFIFAVSALALTVGAANATTSCTDPPSGDLTVTSSTTCSLGSLTFSWEQLTFSPSTPPSTLSIVTPFTGIYGDDYDLNFQFAAGPPPTVDILMTYEVSSTSDNITAVDSSFTQPDGTPPATPASITETVCGADPALTGGQCLDVLAVANNTGGLTYSASFGPEQNIWIIKDVGTGNPISLSTFTDSVVATPEPSTLGLLFLAGFGIVASARKLRKA